MPIFKTGIPYFLRSLTLGYLLSSIPSHKHASRHGWMIFLVTSLIAVDSALENSHDSLRLYLQSRPTPRSAGTNISEWRKWSTRKFRWMVANHPAVATRMISFIFWNKDISQISLRNVSVAMRTIFTCHEVYESIDTFEEDVAVVEDILRPLGPFADRSTAYNFVRPNNPVTNPGVLTPLYYPLLVTVPKALIRYATNLYLKLIAQYTAKKCKATSIVYWSRVRNINSPTVVFFHGIGFGIVPYLLMLSSLLRHCEYDNVILVEFPGISGHSLDIVSRPPTMPYLNRHDVPYPTAREITHSVLSHLSQTLSPNNKVIGVAHSFGTMVLSQIVNTNPETFHHTVYIDPVTFFPGASSLGPCLYAPLTLKTFVRALRDADPIAFITHLAAGDIYTQHIIKQVQQYCEYASKELDKTPPLVVLSGKDHLVDTEAVRDTVRPGTVVWYYDDWVHGDCTMRSDFYQRLGEYLFKKKGEIEKEEMKIKMKSSRSMPNIAGMN
jgi:pimeloyl-ACP methyl ester carboxylesterase